MKILAACECSGRVRDAFRMLGYDAWSCDIQASETPSDFHIQGDICDVLFQDWDLVIAFPPCTHLCASGRRWFPIKIQDGRQAQGIEFFLMFTRLKCRWAIENPIGVMSNLYRDQTTMVGLFDRVYFGSMDFLSYFLLTAKEEIYSANLPQLT